MFPTILSRRFAPAASVQSSYLTLSGCVLLSQGGPGVRLAWHRRQRQELRRQRCTARPLFTVNVWLQSRSLPARGRVGLEVHRCLCIIDAGNVFISTVVDAGFDSWFAPVARSAKTDACG